MSKNTGATNLSQKPTFDHYAYTYNRSRIHVAHRPQDANLTAKESYRLTTGALLHFDLQMNKLRITIDQIARGDCLEAIYGIANADIIRRV